MADRPDPSDAPAEDRTTYVVRWAQADGQGRAGRPSIQCRLCGLTSYHPVDVDQAYCGHCHLFHQAVGVARRMHRDGASHDCGEWQTARQQCAVCGPLVIAT